MKVDNDQNTIEEVKQGADSEQSPDMVSGGDSEQVPGFEPPSGSGAEAANQIVATVETLESELATVRDQLYRQVAEFQNYRRRTEQEKAILVDIGKGMVIQQLLDVVDDLERSIEAASQVDGESKGIRDAFTGLKDGVQLVYQKFTGEMTRLGVEPIDSVGVPFDEALHEAMLQMPAPEGTQPGLVLQVVQKGYRLGDRVLRHARVIVAC